MKIAEIILLCAVPGLMFCIIPVNGMEFRLSWQLAAIWLGGAAFAVFLSSWWWRIFFLIALIRTATMLPAYDAYISLLTIVVFLAAAEGFRRIDQARVMNAMCAAAFLPFAWVMLQKAGSVTAWFAPRLAGPFNPDSGGVFFALCLPAFLRPRWWPFGVVCLTGIYFSQTTTAALAAAASLAVFLFIRSTDTKRIVAGVAVLIALLGLWFWRVDPIAGVVGDQRWIAWKHVAWSMRSEMLGRGLGSFKTVFPLMASGDTRIGSVTNENGKITMSNVFIEGHTQYLQTAFELGLQMALLMVLFAGFVVWMIVTRQAPKHAAAGVAALMVACVGWHVFHIAPLALLGCAWLGTWNRRVES